MRETLEVRAAVPLMRVWACVSHPESKGSGAWDWLAPSHAPVGVPHPV